MSQNRLRIFAVCAALALGMPASADQVVSVAAQGSGTASAKQVTTAAAIVVTSGTNVAAAGTGNVGRKALALQNRGPNSIYCGFASTVTTLTGWEVVANGGTLKMDIGAQIAVYCIAATADQASPTDTRVVELR